MTHLTTPSSVDARLVGLERGPGEHDVSFELVAHLCRGDAALYGGTTIAASLAAMELVTGRPALWATAQLVTSARLGDVVRCEVEIVARGTYIDQVRINAYVEDQLLFASVGSTATGREGGITGVGVTMPDAVGPEDGVEGWHPSGNRNRSWGDSEVGHHRVSEFLGAPRTDGAERPAGQRAMWARLKGEDTTTAATLGFLADMGVAHAICDAAGVAGAGTSLDNSLRVGRLVDTEWVLLDVHGIIAEAGYGHGLVHLWSPDGVLLGTGHQSVKLRTFDSMAAGRA
jgi:acyl-CoA thioesterase-2